ncbi:ABC transporter ATP-binding protein [Mycoplasmoides alvi]|uniref:ABC transporter ATP-binding protein n=1 Tax=Mycoplasmoides alvi TaxID=78580 RepID=UPI00051C1637|nr:ABC transporter ATP-binding protein [Mycoplasmoides alvi]
MNDLVFSINNLRIYPHFNLQNIKFSILQNNICAFIGNNGAGKSSLINLLVKNCHLQNENIFIKNKDLNKISYKELSKLISYVPQINNIYHELSVWDFIAIGRLPHTNFLGFLTKNDKEIIKTISKLLKIDALFELKINQLSGGQLQKVIIANALVQETPIIVLDEPLNHLDLQSQEDMLILIKKLKNDFNKTIIIVLHDIEIAANLADQIVVFYNGSVPLIGKPIDIITSENIKKYFNVDKKIILIKDKFVITNL